MCQKQFSDRYRHAYRSRVRNVPVIGSRWIHGGYESTGNPPALGASPLVPFAQPLDPVLSAALSVAPLGGVGAGALAGAGQCTSGLGGVGALGHAGDNTLELLAALQQHRGGGGGGPGAAATVGVERLSDPLSRVADVMSVARHAGMPQAGATAGILQGLQGLQGLGTLQGFNARASDAFPLHAKSAPGTGSAGGGRAGGKWIERGARDERNDSDELSEPRQSLSQLNRGRPASKVDLKCLVERFGWPDVKVSQPEAARMLGISLTTMKQVCRRLGNDNACACTYPCVHARARACTHTDTSTKAEPPSPDDDDDD